MDIFKKIHDNRIYLFFLFLSFFPTLRILLIGSASSNNIGEFLISALPEICFLVIFSFGFLEFLKARHFHLSLLDKLIIFYFSFNIILGVWLAKDVQLSLYAIRLTYLPMLAYFLASFSAQSVDDWKNVLDRIFKLFVFLSLLGLILYFIFPDVQLFFIKIASDGEVGRYFIIRMTSIFWTPVVFSSVVMVAIIYWTYIYLVKYKIIHLLFLFLLFLSLYLTVSRGAIIAVSLSLILIFILNFKKGKLTHVFGVVAANIIAFIIVGFFISTPAESGKWMVNSAKETIEMKQGVSRVSLWQETIERVKENPLGLGLGKAGHVAARFFDRQNKEASASSTDGWYLKLLAETGVIALVLYVVLMVFFSVMWYRHYRTNGFNYQSLIFVIVVAVAVQNIVSNVLDFYMFSYFYWFLIGTFALKLKESEHA